MTDTMTSQNIDLSSWDTLYMGQLIQCRIVWPWRRRLHKSPLYTSRHGVMSQKSWIFVSHAVKTSNLGSLTSFITEGNPVTVYVWLYSHAVWTCEHILIMYYVAAVELPYIQGFIQMSWNNRVIPLLLRKVQSKSAVCTVSLFSCILDEESAETNLEFNQAIFDPWH